MSRCSAPYISGVSANTAVPPFLTSKVAAAPSAGFAVIPEYASDPPHCNARVSSDTETGSLLDADASGNISSINSNPCATVFFVPPVSCNVIV